MTKLDFLPVSASKGIRDRALAVALFAALAGIFSPAWAEKPPIAGDMKEFIPAEPAKPVPGFAITDLEGKDVTLDAFKGKVVVLNLWATWCVPCIKEMPSLERLSVKMKDKGVAVMSVSQDRGGLKQVGPFLDKHGLKALPIYLDPKGAVLKAIAGRGLPTTLVIDKEGREIGRLEGDADWDGPHAIAIIEHALKQ